MNNVLSLIIKIRAEIMKRVKNRSGYLSERSVKPISTKYGYDRGNPVDRYFINQFFAEYSDDIKGKCLEVVDPKVINEFGGDKVTQADAIDLFVTKQATVYGNLKDLKGVVKSNTYDCLIISQTIHVNDDYDSIIKECYRILKPGGVLLVTLPTLSPTWNLQINMWRFSIESAKHVFSKYFNSKKLTVKSYGNQTGAIFFWSGFAIEEMTAAELKKNDPKMPLIIGVRAVK